MAYPDIISIDTSGLALNDFIKDTNSRLSDLNRAIAKRLTVKSNISSRVVETQISDGAQISIRHNLGRKPDFVSLGFGRVRYYRIVVINTSVVDVIPYLAQTISVETKNRLTNTVEVADSSWMRVGDVLKINDNKFVVRNIVNNVITLSNVVNLKKIRSVTLATDTVNFLIL